MPIGELAGRQVLVRDDSGVELGVGADRRVRGERARLLAALAGEGIEIAIAVDGRADPVDDRELELADAERGADRRGRGRTARHQSEHRKCSKAKLH